MGAVVINVVVIGGSVAFNQIELLEEPFGYEVEVGVLFQFRMTDPPVKELWSGVHRACLGVLIKGIPTPFVVDVLISRRTVHTLKRRFSTYPDEFYE